jgi:peptidyl-prolyl cis-trans isomerase B (cyclophilin B)
MRYLVFVLMLFSVTPLSIAQEKTMAVATTVVKMTTSLGEIMIEVDHKNAPISADNFIRYVKDGFYNNTLFHRIIPDFMAQAGGFDVDFKEKPTQASIKNEANNGLKNERGTLAMARTNDPQSASSQFFINYKANDFLNYSSATPQGWGYAVFAKVTKGMEIVEAMAKQPTGSKGSHQDVPTTNIVIETMEIVE